MDLETLRQPTAAERADAGQAASVAECQEFQSWKPDQKWKASNPQIDHCLDWALDGLKYPADAEAYHAETLLDLLACRPVAGAYWAGEAMGEASDADLLAILKFVAAGDNAAAGVMVGRILLGYAKACLEYRMTEVAR